MKYEVFTNTLKTKNIMSKKLLLLFAFISLAGFGNAQTAYIPCFNDNNVYVINVATNTVIDTIKGFSNPQGHQ
jgi:YVTN family beta-propeller protein